MLFKNRLKKRSKQQIEYENLVFSNFNKTVNNSTFMSYRTFINQAMLQLNISKKDEIWNEILSKSVEYIESKNEIVYKNFVISFERDTRFSLYTLVPTLNREPNPKLKSLDLVKSADIQTNNILVQFNDLINSLLDKGLEVEILPEIIVSYDKLIDKYTILFGKKFVENDAH